MLLLVQPRLLLAAFAARGHCWLMPSLHPPTSPSPSQQSCFPSQLRPCCAIAGSYSAPGQNLAFVLAELQEVPLCPLLRPIYLPLEGTSALKRTNWLTQCDGICKSDAGVLHLLYQGISKDVKIPLWLT